MTESEKILAYEMDLIRLDLIERHLQLGLKSSGDWINSLEVVSRGLSSTILGNHYTEQLVNGRGPGKFPPVAAIVKWIEEKPVLARNISVSSLAFLIARKIAREGTEIFKKGGTDLIEAVITPERVQRIINNVTEFHINHFTSQVKGVFKQFA